MLIEGEGGHEEQLETMRFKTSAVTDDDQVGNRGRDEGVESHRSKNGQLWCFTSCRVVRKYQNGLLMVGGDDYMPQGDEDGQDDDGETT